MTRPLQSHPDTTGADIAPLDTDVAEILARAESLRVGLASIRRRALMTAVTGQSNEDWLRAYDGGAP